MSFVNKLTVHCPQNVASLEQGCPLLDLPPELRNTIYEILMVESRIEVACEFSQRRLENQDASAYCFKTDRSPGAQAMSFLTTTCRQIHFETALLSFSMAEIYFNNVEIAIGFLCSRLPIHCAAIQHVTIEIKLSSDVWLLATWDLPEPFIFPSRRANGGRRGIDWGAMSLGMITERMRKHLPRLETLDLENGSGFAMGKLITGTEELIGKTLVRVIEK